MKPTPAQIEAALKAYDDPRHANPYNAIVAAITAAAEAGQDYDLKCTHGHDKCNEMYPADDCPYCERVPAAAEVEENKLIGHYARPLINATIERCIDEVQAWFDDAGATEDAATLIAAIRALKDK